MHLDDWPLVLAVQERDIDLLILEELHATPAFAAWWAAQLGLSRAMFDGAWHSVSNADGETDVLLRVHVGQERIGILIENKIAAAEQHEQAVRYHRRGEQGVSDGWFDRYVTCMVAPQAYLSCLSDQLGYDGEISYEAVAEWFASQSDARSVWRKRVVEEAIAQGRRGYTKVVSDAVTAFHRDYYDHLCRTQASLRMNPPGPRGGQGYWIILWQDGWPKHVRINHKMKRDGWGTVELGLVGLSSAEIVARVGVLPPDIVPLTTGRYGSLAIRVPPLDYRAPLLPQLGALDKAFAAMLRLASYARIFDVPSSGGGEG